MARHIKNKSCCEQVEEGAVTFRTNFLAIVRDIFRLNHTKPAAKTLSYSTARKAEKQVMAIQAQVAEGQAQFRRLQMIQ